MCLALNTPRSGFCDALYGQRLSLVLGVERNKDGDGHRWLNEKNYVHATYRTLHVASRKKGIFARSHHVPDVACALRPRDWALFLFLELFHYSTPAILRIFPHPPPIRLISPFYGAFELSIPPVLGHLKKPHGHYSRDWYRFRCRRLDAIGKEASLLAQQRGLCEAVLGVEGDGEV